MIDSVDRPLNATRPLIVALTGGIASGKSAAERCFAKFGAQVIDADVMARELVMPGQEALSLIVERFGAEMLDSTGALDRGRLRTRIFADADARRALEAILHPRIKIRMKTLAEGAQTAYVILAIPLLIETADDYAWVDRVLVIDAPTTLQRQRLLARDGGSPEQADAILAAQAIREARLGIAHDVIVNDGPLDALHHAAVKLDRRYRNITR